MKVLICGLSGSGKTELSKKLLEYVECDWFNADKIREEYNDWDFTDEGRKRQANRMFELSKNKNTVIADFIAPTEELRNIFKPDLIIWMDTVSSSKYEDTDKIFEEPDYDIRITGFTLEQGYDVEKIAGVINGNIELPEFDYQKETVQMLGRWQPWHTGHRALFERAIKKTGQVCIMIRDCQGWNKSNPFNFIQVEKFIKKDLDPLYKGMYEILVVPNIINITYGRDVGYSIEQEVFTDEIHNISATKIRKEMGIS